MNDIRKFIKENRPQVKDSDRFMADTRRQLDLLPEPPRQDRLLRLSGRLAVISILSTVLIAILLCSLIFIAVQSSGLLSGTLTYVMISVVFATSVLVPLYKQEIL